MDYYNLKLTTAATAVTKLIQALGVPEPEVTFERTADLHFGHLTTNVAMRYAKHAGLSSSALAEKIAACIEEVEHPFIERVECVRPGFVNIRISPGFFNKVLQEVLDSPSSFGKGGTRTDEKWVIEHTSPNPNKAMHIGHLRINLIGMSLANIIEWEGAEVTRDAVDNNRGIAIAKLMYGFLILMKKDPLSPATAEYWHTHQEKWHTPQSLNVLPDVFVTQCYVAGEKASKDDIAIDLEIRNMAVEWEKDNTEVRALWSLVIGYSHEGMNRTLTRLHNHWDKVWHEDEYYQEGKMYVEKGLEQGIFKRLPDGAVLTDLASFDLPDTIVLKKDGTSLYITQDIALTARKKALYGDVDYMVWVVGPEQSTALAQVFAVCEQLGIGQRKEFIHVTYGYVGLADKDKGLRKMSSRTGDVILIDTVIDAVKERVHEKLTTENADTAETLALAAVKFAILKPSKDQTIAFDMERSTDTQGDSGVYALYTYARICGIIRKASEQGCLPKVTPDVATDNDTLMVSQFPWFYSAIEKASIDHSPHHIVKYVLDVCGQFNNWYSHEMILDPHEDIKAHKVAITIATGIIVKNALGILGIDTVDRI